MYDITEVDTRPSPGTTQPPLPLPLPLPLSLPSAPPPLLLAGIDEEEWGEPHVVRGID
ncbi:MULTISPECIES: surface protein [unclassified Streptomyces]|uniref:surface protein n=1 Tax=unclassified Streptomyces TaxID=2593676 RepID=UPI002E29C33F|nr:surface protein [Streptomyces sp. NBC_00228]